MKNSINIAVVGLGQIGNYLLNELNNKKKVIKLLTGKDGFILPITLILIFFFNKSWIFLSI